MSSSSDHSVHPPIIDTLGQLTVYLAHAPTVRPWPVRKRVLMVTPDHFRIDYAINPYMRTDSGELQPVDRERAKQEWIDLKAVYEKLGFTVDTLGADAALPDMVFAANQSFPYWDAAGKPAVLMSRMKAPERQPEVAHFRRWYESQGYEVHELAASDATFEGNGDALPQPGHGFIWGGVGARTSRTAYEELARLTGLAVIRLPLQAPEFYHLDTCFSVLTEDTVVVQPKAFSTPEMRMIHEVFDHVIDVEHEEAVKRFAGNCHSPDGKHVIMQRGARKLVRDLEKKNFDVIEVETDEFMKSGGSVFCLKMQLF